jgi:predicted GNAT family N-acyltransferase
LSLNASALAPSQSPFNIDRVKTRKDYREKEYAGALIHYLIRYHASISTNALYLGATSPIAVYMYKRVDFVDVEEKLKSWGAVKE